MDKTSLIHSIYTEAPRIIKEPQPLIAIQHRRLFRRTDENSRRISSSHHPCPEIPRNSWAGLSYPLPPHKPQCMRL